METSELIRRASNRDISTYDNLSLYFDTVRLETDFEKARPHYEHIYDIAAQQKVKLALSDQQTAIKFYELAKKAALMLAPHLFHYIWWSSPLPGSATSSSSLSTRRARHGSTRFSDRLVLTMALRSCTASSHSVRHDSTSGQ